MSRHTVWIADSGRLVPMQRPIPHPGPEQILLKVEASGVNRPDILQVAGLYPPPPGQTNIVGLEAAGTIAAVGAGITRWKIGDRVAALLEGGGCADYALADAGLCLPLPESIPFCEAAALPEALATIVGSAAPFVVPGEAVLVHGGSGGLGHLAIQVFKSVWGCFVFTTCRHDKRGFCEDVGADKAIAYDQEDFSAMIRAHPHHSRVALVVDSVGGDTTASNLAVLRPGGTLVQLAFQRGCIVTVDMLPLLLKRLHWTGSTLRSRPLSEKRAIIVQVEREVWPVVVAGKIRPHLDTVLPLSSILQAHARLQGGEVRGKVVLTA